MTLEITAPWWVVTPKVTVPFWLMTPEVGNDRHDPKA